MTLLAGARRTAAEEGQGLELRLLSAREVLEARREAAGLTREDRERALCANACLLARALERGGEPVFSTGGAVLEGLSVEQIASLPGGGRAGGARLKKSLEHAPYARLQWRVLRAFGALPTEPRARAMTDRDYLWCALNLLLDGEEALDALCPACRAEAREGRCPVCGAATGGDRTGENAGFDPERFERMRRGEKA